MLPDMHLAPAAVWQRSVLSKPMAGHNRNPEGALKTILRFDWTKMLPSPASAGPYKILSRNLAVHPASFESRRAKDTHLKNENLLSEPSVTKPSKILLLRGPAFTRQPCGARGSFMQTFKLPICLWSVGRRITSRAVLGQTSTNSRTCVCAD